MKRLQEMDDDIKRSKCSKCDYLNNAVAISKKRTNCVGLENMMECEAFMETSKLKNRVNYITGKIGALFVCRNIHFGEDQTDSD